MGVINGMLFVWSAFAMAISCLLYGWYSRDSAATGLETLAGDSFVLLVATIAVATIFESIRAYTHFHDDESPLKGENEPPEPRDSA